MKLNTTAKRRSFLESEPNYHTTKFFSENILEFEMDKTKIKMNETACLGVSVLNIRKIEMYEYWYDDLKPSYCNKVKLCSMDMEIFIVHVKRNDVYADREENVKTRLNTTNYECNSPLAKGRNKQVISSMKDKLGRIIIRGCCIMTKMYSF